MLAIKEMEMPECCLDCDFCQYIGDPVAVCVAFEYKKVDLKTSHNRRAKWCPLIDIKERE